MDGAEVYLQSFVALALDAGELSPSRPGHFTPGKNGGTLRIEKYGVSVWIGFIWLGNLYRTAVSPMIELQVLIS